MYMRMALTYDMAYLHTETSARRMLSNELACPLQRKQLKGREILKRHFNLNFSHFCDKNDRITVRLIILPSKSTYFIQKQ